MEYDDLIKNIKTTLVKAANEGKKKGIAFALAKTREVFDKNIENFKNSFNDDLKAIVDEIEKASTNDGDATKEK